MMTPPMFRKKKKKKKRIIGRKEERKKGKETLKRDNSSVGKTKEKRKRAKPVEFIQSI